MKNGPLNEYSTESEVRFRFEKDDMEQVDKLVKHVKENKVLKILNVDCDALMRKRLVFLPPL